LLTSKLDGCSGVHAVADSAGEVIAAAVDPMSAGMTVTQLADAWCPYLTMTEAQARRADIHVRRH